MYLPLDGRIFRAWARFMHQRSEDLLVDGLLAATAQVHNLQIVTRNVRDFVPFGLTTLNPFESRHPPRT